MILNITEDTIKAMALYHLEGSGYIPKIYKEDIKAAFVAGAQWMQEAKLTTAEHEAIRNEREWYSVHDRTPAIDEDVIALDQHGRICFAHVVDADKVESYDGWNVPGIVFWREFNPSKDMDEFYGQDQD